MLIMKSTWLVLIQFIRVRVQQKLHLIIQKVVYIISLQIMIIPTLKHLELRLLIQAL